MSKEIYLVFDKDYHFLFSKVKPFLSCFWKNLKSSCISVCYLMAKLLPRSNHETCPDKTPVIFYYFSVYQGKETGAALDTPPIFP